MTTTTDKKSTKKWFKKWWVWAAVVGILFIGYKVIAARGKSPYQFVTVKEGPITESVSVTGNTTPLQSVSLGFQNSGTIAHVYYDLGATVHAGDVIAELNTAALRASINQAQAAVDQQKASLASLEQGTLPEQISIDQTAVTNDERALGNVISNAYVEVEDALVNKIYPFFSTVSTNKEPIVLSSQYNYLLDSIKQALSPWSAEVATLSTADPVAIAQADDTRLTLLMGLVDQVSTAVNTQASTSNYSVDTIQTLLAQITSARLTLTSSKSAIDTALSTLSTAKGTLALAQAGATSNNIAAQTALVEQAEAGLASAEANLRNAELIAPISGTITMQSGKIGQSTTPGTQIVSIIGTGGFEVDAGISEIDVGKIVVGDTVTMKLDAFPNETFNGSVFYVAPTQTNNQGVITYLAKISFEKADPRLKSGLTANININTKHKDSVLILPEYAILQNDQGTYVETLVNKTVTKVPVTLGIQDQDGNVEVTSGVTKDEQVLNVGLKS